MTGGGGLLWYVLNAILGSLTYCLLWYEFDRIEVLRRVALGGISGYVYWLAQPRFGLPDGFMAFVVGYFSADFLEALFESLQRLVIKTGKGDAQ